ncbi:MAG: hypothetical protein K8R68_03415 [Bacteroidales bacterium]|nr:hypothetical protein [Bacteroidales bacterium]
MFGIISVLQIFKLIQVLTVSAIKFIFAPLISFSYGFNYFQTVIFTTLGGILGFVFFYYFSKWIIRQYYRFCPIVYSYFTGIKIEQSKKILNCRQKPKKVFTKKNKMILNIRKKYGFLGIVILTPVLLSIPIGAFLAQKYYSKKNNVLVYIAISLVFWSFFISSVFFLF